MPIFNSNDLAIRLIKKSEYPMLEIFLYEALHVPAGYANFPKETIYQPEIYLYIDNFGGPDDICFAAIKDEQIVGAAWSRILCETGKKGFGNIDAHTPELAISVLPQFRGGGIGTKLLNALHTELANKKYAQISLSVQKTNIAYNLYKRLGYKTIREEETDYIMVKKIF